MGVFFLGTGVVILVPLFLQLRSRERDWREVWGFLLLAVGLFTLGFCYLASPDPVRYFPAWVGLGIILAGFLIQMRRPRSGPERNP